MTSTLAQETSINQINIQTTNQEKDNSSTPTPIYMAGINQLELQANRSNQEDLRQISKILKQILMYPDLQCTEMHIRAMQLGNFDLQDQPPPTKQRFDTSASMLSQQSKNELCPCCGFKIQTQNIAICHPFDKIKNMGLSTFLFFATFKNLSILLTIMLVIYSGFALATNVLAANLLNQSGIINYSKIDYINISLSSKQTYDTPTNRMYYYISCWLGVATAIIWLLVVCAIKHTEIKDSMQYDQDTISCSDYSIVIEGVPLNVTQQQLQKQFDQYFQTSIKNSSRFPQIWKQPLRIVKINVGKPFYLHQDQLKDQEIQEIDKEIAQIKEKVAEWIIQRRNSNSFRDDKGERESTYQRYAKLIQNRNKKCIQLSNRITAILKKDDGKREDLTNVFVTFQLNNNKTLLNFIHDSGILSRIRALCNPQHQRFIYKQDGKEYKIHLARAPEPEDILWTNIGQKNFTSYMKKFFTFTITVILLGISFAIVFGLTKLQQSKNDDRLISIVISLTISIVNAIIGQVIRVLTVFEKDYTETYRQASLSIKSILAQMVNAIIIPVVSAYKITGNLYYASGLVDNIFMLSISTSLIPPILVFIDPENLYMKIKRCFKSVPTRKLYQTQKEHNALHEGLQFQVGFQYIYPVNVFIFTCYFVSLQPIVALIGMIGYFLMYWAQKYCLFNRYRRPVPGSDFVNNAVYKIILLGPFIFGLGSMTWSNFTPGGIPPEALLPNLVIVGISVIIFFIPYNTVLLGWCFSNNYERNKKYDDQRIIFPSEYDRLNPSTQQEGVQDYKKYLQRKVKEIQQMPKEKQTQFAQQYMLNAQRAQTVQRGNTAVYGNMQYYRPVQPMQPFKQMSFMGMPPFASGFNMASFNLLPGMPFAPNMPLQPFPQMRPQQPPRPMINQGFPSPGMVIPPPVVYQAQPIHHSRPMQYPQQMMQQPPHPNHNQMMHPNGSRPNLQPQQMNFPLNPVALLSNQGVKMNQNPSTINLGFRPGNGNNGQNRGW